MTLKRRNRGRQATRVDDADRVRILRLFPNLAALITALSQLDGSLDDIADGATYGRPLLTRLNAGKPWIDFAEAIHSGKHLDNLADGTTYGRPKLTGLTSGEIDLSKAGVINRTLDNISETATRKHAAESGATVGAKFGVNLQTSGGAGISDLDGVPDGTTYKLVKATALTSGEVDLAKAGVIGRNLGNISDDATYGRTKLTGLTSGEVDLSKSGVLNKSADNISESGSRKWAGESGADVTSGKSVNVLTDVKSVAQFFTYTQTITATGSSTITIPTGAKLLVIRAWGAGGGGASVALEASSAGGGGGGAGVKKTVQIKTTDHGQTISYTVGTGGTGRTTTAGDGTAGTATTVTSSGLSFTNLNISAGGGAGGTTAAGGAGGTASGGDTNTSGSGGIFSATSEGGWSAFIDSIGGIGGYEDSSGSPGEQPLSPEQPGGGGAGNGAGDGQNGADGMVTFTWSG